MGLGYRLLHQELTKIHCAKLPSYIGSFACICFNNRPLLGALECGRVTMRHILTRSAFLLLVISLAFGMSACREEEQGRPLNYEKGTYLGKVDSSLNNEQLRELNSRTRFQSNY